MGHEVLGRAEGPVAGEMGIVVFGTRGVRKPLPKHIGFGMVFQKAPRCSSRS